MILTLLKELFTNLAIFTSTTILLHNLFKNKQGVDFTSIHQASPQKLSMGKKIALGLSNGVIATIIMFYGLHLVSGTLVDLRHLPILISALFGGLPSALITSGIIAINRIFFFTADSSLPSVIGAINAMNMAVGCGIISRHASQNKWVYMNLYCLVSITIIAVILIHDGYEWMIVVLSMWSISIISSFCIYLLLNYLIKSNALHQQIEEAGEKFRLITENMIDVVTVLNTEGRILYVSPSIQRFGVEPEHYIHMDPIKFIHPQDVKSVQDLFYRALHKKSVLKTEFRWKYGDGDWIYVDMRGTPIEQNGKLTQFVLVSRDITDRKRLEQKLTYLSHFDGLTGIANRRYFDEVLDQAWIKSIHESTSLSLLLFDIDYFKTYNDTYGHQAGDQCLQQVAEVLKNVVKPPHIAARYGGEEFAVILPRTEQKEAKLLAEIIRMSIVTLQIPHCYAKEYDVVTVSIGLSSEVATGLETPNQLIEKADKALYQSKRDGRNRVTIYHDSR